MTKKIKLDAGEKSLQRSFEKGQWKSVKNIEEERKVAQKAAAKTLSKDVRINMRTSSSKGHL